MEEVNSTIRYMASERTIKVGVGALLERPNIQFNWRFFFALFVAGAAGRDFEQKLRPVVHHAPAFAF